MNYKNLHIFYKKDGIAMLKFIKVRFVYKYNKKNVFFLTIIY
jgi:hypothetical protein